MDTICITIDMEWAPDEILAELTEILECTNINATVFATHKSGVNLSKHEVALHPDFLRHLNHKDHLLSLSSCYPDAVGIRTHSLYTHSKIQECYAELGFHYVSNYLLDRMPNIRPVQYIGLTEFPIYFIDDLNVRSELPNKFSKESLNLSCSGLKVFAFHPLNVYLNLEHIERLNAAKEFYHNPRKLACYCNKKAKGTKDLLLDLLEHIKEKNIKVKMLKEVLGEFN